MKIKTLSLVIVSSVLFYGCGGGSSDSNTSSSSSSSTTVPVTKGPLLQAIAVDSSETPKSGTQIAGTNKYTFNGEVTYPITVTGGYVDVNNNGVVDEGDYKFTGKLSSYSEVVTPITTYLGDTSKDQGKNKLTSLKSLSGVTSDSDFLTKDPSETNEDILALVASIYETYPDLMDNDDSNNDINDDIADENSVLSSKFQDYKNILSSASFENETLDKKLVRVEQHLRDNSGVDVLNELDVEKINFSKKDLVGNKLSVANETYYFRENDIVLGDAGDDYTQMISYGPIENGSVKLLFSNGDYDLIALSETGFDISNFENDILDEKVSITSELTEYTTSELTTVLLDVPFELTRDMIAGKEILVFDEDGQYKGQYKNDGTYL